MIGPLLPTDRDRWTELWGQYLDFYKTTLPASVYDHTWSRILADDALHALAFRKDGKILGATHFLFHDSAWTMTQVCYLQDLFVDKDTRGLGIGRSLVEAVAAAARARNSARLYWLTQSDNHVARGLYDAIARHTGFIRYEYPPL